MDTISEQIKNNTRKYNAIVQKQDTKVRELILEYSLENEKLLKNGQSSSTKLLQISSAIRANAQNDVFEEIQDVLREERNIIRAQNRTHAF